MKNQEQTQNLEIGKQSKNALLFQQHNQTPQTVDTSRVSPTNEQQLDSEDQITNRRQDKQKRKRRTKAEMEQSKNDKSKSKNKKQKEKTILQSDNENNPNNQSDDDQTVKPQKEKAFKKLKKSEQKLIAINHKKPIIEKKIVENDSSLEMHSHLSKYQVEDKQEQPSKVQEPTEKRKSYEFQDAKKPQEQNTEAKESKGGEIDSQTLNNLTAQNQLQFQELLMKLMQQNSQIAQNVNFNMLINPHVNSINQMPSSSGFQDVFNEINKNLTLQPVKKNNIVQDKMYSSQQQAPLTQIFNSNNSPDSNEIFGIKKGNNLKIDKQTIQANQDFTEDTMGNSLGDNYLDDKFQEKKKKIKERTVKIKPFNPDSEEGKPKEKVKKGSKQKDKKKKKVKEKKSQSKEAKEKKKKSKSKDPVEKKAIKENKSIHQFLKITHKKQVKPVQEEPSTMTNETCDLIVQNKLSPLKDSNLDLSTESKTPDQNSEQKKQVLDQKKQWLEKEQDQLAAEALDFYEKDQKDKEKEDLISLSSIGKEQMNDLTRKQLQELNSKVQKQFNQLNSKVKKDNKLLNQTKSIDKKGKSGSIDKKGKNCSIENTGQMQIQQFKVMDKLPSIVPIKAPIKITQDFSKFESAIYQPISLKAIQKQQVQNCGAENSSDLLKLTAEPISSKKIEES